MWWLIIPAVVVVGGWLYGATKVAANAPPLPHDPVPVPVVPVGKPTGFTARDGNSINIGSIIEVDVLSMTPDEILSVPILGLLKNGDLVVKEHIDDTMVFKVSPDQFAMQTGFINAVLFDSRIGFSPNASALFKANAPTFGNAIPASKVRNVFAGT